MQDDTQAGLPSDVGASAPRRDDDLIQQAMAQARAIASGHGASATQVRSQVATDSFPGYQIVREIHRGGQGVVYQAVQKTTTRKVAIKVMHSGGGLGSAGKARFEREVQILSQLSHPNIVKVHDSGMSDGHLFYVMDYISGESLDAAAKKLPLRGALELMAKVAEAVNAAHLRGIIHRDLKPGNVRVDVNGEPFVVDFGLAKIALGERVEDAEAMSMTGQFIGSLMWASPEQAETRPDKIDVRTDVYSMGVMLFQILTGDFPYPVKGSMPEVMSAIITREPARPSSIRKELDDEVDTIILKCLAKERERRYQTAGELARDIRLYLAGEAIEAKKDSALYMARKFVKRHLVLVSSAAILVVMLIGFSITMGVLYREATVAKSRLKVSLDTTQAAAAAMEQQILANDPVAARKAADEELGAIVEKIATAAKGAGDKDPELVVRKAASEAFSASSRWAAAEPHVRRALELQMDAGTGNDRDTAALLASLATVHSNLGQFEDGEKAFARAIEILEAIIPAEGRDADMQYLGMIHNLARLHQRRGGEYLAQAESEYDRLARVFSSRMPAPGTAPTPADAETRMRLIQALRYLSDVRVLRGNLEGAEQAALAAVAAAEELGQDELARAVAALQLGRVRHEQKRYEEAERGYMEAIRIYSVPGRSPAQLLNVQSFYAALLRDWGQHDRAVELCRAMRDRAMDAFGPAAWQTAVHQRNLGQALASAGKNEEAERELLQSHASLQASLGKAHSDTREAASALATLYRTMKRPTDESRYRELAAAPKPAP